MSEKLDLSPFRNALEELEKTHAHSQSEDVKKDPEIFGIIRTAIVKGFEYTYGLAVKFIERFLEVYDTDHKVGEKLVFHAMLRQALEFRLITNDKVWLHYRDLRNTTSHGYHVAVADKIYAEAPALIKDSRFILTAMDRHMARIP